MAKYHFNSITGRVGQCRATKKGCPLGGDTPHFDTKEAAKAYVEAEAKSSHQSFTKFSKSSKNTAGEIDDFTAARNRFTVEMMALETEYHNAHLTDSTYGDGAYRTGEELKKLADDFERSGYSDEGLEKLNSELADIAEAIDLAGKRAFENNDYNELDYTDGARDMINKMTEITEEYDGKIYWAKKEAAKANEASEKTAPPNSATLNELREDFKNNYKSMATRATPFLNKNEMGDLEKISMGDKVPAKRLDLLIDKLRFAGRDDAYAKDGVAKKGEQVLETLKAVRAQDPTPSTLTTTAKTFDPSKQTVLDFSKNNNHDDVGYAVNKIKHTLSNIDNYNKLMEDHEKSALGHNMSIEESNKFINSAKIFEEEANREKALLSAQIKEFTHKYNNDPEFKRNMTPQQSSYMDAFNGDEDNVDEIIPRVKDIK